MAAATADIGLIGLAVMGENLVLNVESRGFAVAVFNRTTARVDEFLAGRAKGKRIVGCHSVKELAAALKRPRKVMMMVKAGPAVDQVIEEVAPLLEPGDILIDGGNTHYPDTTRRTKALQARGLLGGLAGLDAAALHDVFARWNKGPLDSYLIEITRDIFGYRDPETGKPLVDLILDAAGQKGTGKWMVGSATELGVPLTLITEAVF